MGLSRLEGAVDSSRLPKELEYGSKQRQSDQVEVDGQVAYVLANHESRQVGVGTSIELILGSTGSRNLRVADIHGLLVLKLSVVDQAPNFLLVACLQGILEPLDLILVQSF